VVLKPHIIKAIIIMKFFKKITPLSLITFVITIVIFLKNAWVGEDAYILFRSLDQLIAGNGPVWNPHNRVQIFTSPLWYFILALIRTLNSDVYLNVIVLSFILLISTVLVIKAILKNDSILLLSVLLLTASTAFFDYTSSGLENVLAYFIIALYILNYLKLFNIEDTKSDQINKHGSLIKIILFLFGLIICVRHDLALLLLPSTIYAILKNSKVFSFKQWVLVCFIAFLPIILYTLFSLIYFGFPFPNTAYAKLNTGINKIEIFKQGVKYFISSIVYDSLTLLVIIGFIFLSLFRPISNHLKYLGYGVLLNLFYVGYIGGDFMQGRFLSYAYLVSVLILLLSFAKIHSQNFKLLTFIAIGCYLVFYPHTPFNSPIKYRNQSIKWGVADERGYYFGDLSLYWYIRADQENKGFPDNNWAREGYDFKESSDDIKIKHSIGLFGYHSGIEKIIIDSFALSDPLLARIPVSGPWRIGHFRRTIPDGYIDSIISGNEVIDDPQINEYYKKLKVVTQNEELFSLERLKTIILFNLGAYNHLLPVE